MSHNAHAAPATATIGPSQRTFLSWTTDVLIYMVVIGLFAQFTEPIHVPSFMVLILVAIAMKILLVIVGRFEHAIHGFFEERGLHVVAIIATFATLFLGKLAILEVMAILFPEVHLGHFVSVLVLILAMILAVVVVHKIYQSLGPDELEDTLI